MGSSKTKPMADIEDRESLAGSDINKPVYRRFFYSKNSVADIVDGRHVPSCTKYTHAGEKNKDVLGSKENSISARFKSTNSRKWTGHGLFVAPKSRALSFGYPCLPEIQKSQIPKKNLTSPSGRKTLLTQPCDLVYENVVQPHKDSPVTCRSSIDETWRGRVMSNSAIWRSLGNKWGHLKPRKKHTESFPVLTRGVNDITNADPNSQKALTLTYLVVQTSYGFSTVKTSPRTDCDEAIFHQK